jgi:hypothetical protein
VGGVGDANDVGSATTCAHRALLQALALIETVDGERSDGRIQKSGDFTVIWHWELLSGNMAITQLALLDMGPKPENVQFLSGMVLLIFGLC